ncbi:uncharacterized protein A1O5_12522 [Cladophialophora psammophila CBS 110553]|uniref:AMP-dependent synthetase/ligase domain-containing protein n=1 Tax=Cladophialophora psammophila CBS 110553 TaxID=1182543 RepID=W9VPS6_9EURO|nr:uncharacterized protein A1O5_12522 [Cladophialophora psammophila CBS 110553]EXJ57732.1 hypothetical protein A1O5_12522 [Cladophialophora psammophila CBS 110553]
MPEIPDIIPISDLLRGNSDHNQIDTLTISWALHRVIGLSSPANSNKEEELDHQLRSSKAQILFTVSSDLPTAREAASKDRLAEDRRILCQPPSDESLLESLQTVSQMIGGGCTLSELDELQFTKKQDTRQIAFLCYYGGSLGAPQAIMISHYNEIVNLRQLHLFDRLMKDAFAPHYRDNALCLMPFFPPHICRLVAVCHISI